MGKQKRKMKNKKSEATKEDFGNCVLFCKACNYEFEIEWETIFAIQEVTHGYVGFHLNDVFINCPKCDEIVSDSSDKDYLLPDTKQTKQHSKSIDDYELPF
ncbi:hypothetical protein NC661_05650 [Aquibacillus koreensis]|uniref:Uncharacterized protein n=1 Tax=Aquibacillus koreensis TaxID=279446 RepID=A0A9X3WJP4_9BACI|nr:hypothetical protein [Aquibacillus koreensis]MCT2537167.1 hypothetical protein [Aquibacillus koreensis]MDC3419850.1 hypothetical protein [Aquibacillus koreensis]